MSGVVSIGQPLPDIALTGPEGAAISLAGFRRQDTLLIFLRHLA